jgi:phage shock protein A
LNANLLDAHSDTLPLATRMLEQKLTEAKSKKDTLKARAKSASASKQITEMIQGLNTSNALTAFDKMEEKVMALEAESESTLQVGFRLWGAPP